MTLPACDAERPVGAGAFPLLLRIHRRDGPAAIMQRVAPGAYAACDAVSQRRMPTARLILTDATMAMQALELRLSFGKVVTIRAMFWAV